VKRSQPLVQAFTRHKLHDHIEGIAFNFKIIHLNNARVAQSSYNPGLVAETINKIMSSTASGEIIVTYPEALFEKVVSPLALEKTRIEIVMNETLDVAFLIEMLVDYGFERVDFVFEPGQFSIRGGIIDIFSYGNEWPYRVELFDDEVESIRTFDPTTQLSKLKIAKVSIIPNVNTRFSKDQKV